MGYNLIIRGSADEPLYDPARAVEMARISLELLRACEAEELVQPRTIAGGGLGYTLADIRRLARIRRLQEEMELDLGAIDVVLHLRRQVLGLLSEVEAMEERMLRREQELLAEIQSLRRRLAGDAYWEW
jgi:DNA-binding transcriptional MerR regulator